MVDYILLLIIVFVSSLAFPCVYSVPVVVSNISFYHDRQSARQRKRERDRYRDLAGISLELSTNYSKLTRNFQLELRWFDLL